MFCSLLLHISLYIVVSLTALVFCIGNAMNLLLSLFFYRSVAFRVRIKLVLLLLLLFFLPSVDMFPREFKN